MEVKQYRLANTARVDRPLKYCISQPGQNVVHSSRPVEVIAVQNFKRELLNLKTTVGIDYEVDVFADLERNVAIDVCALGVVVQIVIDSFVVKTIAMPDVVGRKAIDFVQLTL